MSISYYLWYIVIIIGYTELKEDGCMCCCCCCWWFGSPSMEAVFQGDGRGEMAGRWFAAALQHSTSREIFTNLPSLCSYGYRVTTIPCLLERIRLNKDCFLIKLPQIGKLWDNDELLGRHECMREHLSKWATSKSPRLYPHQDDGSRDHYWLRILG